MARRLLDDDTNDVVATPYADRPARRGPFGRIALFLRQVGTELRKVKTPTRRELISYTGVVLAFVVILMAVVYVLDLAFSSLVVLLFGTPGS